MSIFSRLTDIVQANLNAMLDRAEDPEKMIRLIIQEMEDTLVEVRSSTVKIIAEKKELERRLADVARDEAEWDRKAEVALTRGREDLAKGALLEKAKVTEQTASLARQIAAVEGSLAKANEDIGRLQAKLNDAKGRETALTARHKSAASRIKVTAALHDERINDALARFEQVERNLDEMEGRAESLDLGRRKSLSEEISDLESAQKVDADLEALRARLAAKK
jgi:phage shock protein A